MLTSFCIVVWFAVADGCYWNAQCPYQLYGSKTPYETTRGDIRDHHKPANCEAISIWTFNRHGNRNPSPKEISGMKNMTLIQDKIVAIHEAGGGELCAQDVENLKNWSWDSSIDDSLLNLTSTGYTELYRIAQRIRSKYSKLLNTSSEDFYFRSTGDKRAISSIEAFIKGITEGTDIDIRIEDPVIGDEVIRPYETCVRYQQEVKHGKALENIMNLYYESPEVLAIIPAVQKRLGFPASLNAHHIYYMYQLCRFYRTWSPTHQNPWCAFFSTEDLQVLEYHDDLKRYYKNGHGFSINKKLGSMVLKNLYKNFKAVTQGKGKKMVALSSHATMMEMTIGALGLFKDLSHLQSNYINPQRLWRTSHISPISGNLLAVLNRCNESNSQTYKVQIFLHEKKTSLCPEEGCTWEEFEDMMEPHSHATLDFCNRDYVDKESEDELSSGGETLKPFWSI